MTIGNIIRSFNSTLARFISDDQGGETVEWVLVLGLIAVACLIAAKGFGVSLANWWNNAANAL